MVKLVNLLSVNAWLKYVKGLEWFYVSMIHRNLLTSFLHLCFKIKIIKLPSVSVLPVVFY